jgi:hypothetical protein
MKKKNNIIRNFDNFSRINEETSLLGFGLDQLGVTAKKAIQEQVAKYALDYFGIAEDAEKGTLPFVLKEIMIALVGSLSMDEMDALLTGEQPIDDGDFWSDKLAHAVTHYLSKYYATNTIIEKWGLNPDTLIGRIISHMVDNVIRDEEEVKRLLLTAWNIFYNKQLVPSKTSGELYQQAYNALTPAQKKRAQAGGSLWSASVRQGDILRGGKK